ncbi:MAG: Gfo/Idh/MocA family oxidoreductase [Candidatus Planktophila sp.]|nr:Gfo/Idh/MocA family oxidoreductase [Candidatus Planktophila sp.]
MSNFSWGILGPGGIARAFAKDLTLLEGHTIGAVGSRSLSNAQSFADDFGGTAYGSYEELLNDSTIDAIYVATPHPAHHDNVISALDAGKAVLCEKPFAVNAKQAQAMVDAATRNKVALMEAMWARFLPHYAQVREIIASDVLGPIISIHADHGQRLADQNIPRLIEPQLAGGALLDLGIYPISFAHMILGNPVAINSSAVMTDKGVDAQSSMIFTYENGAQAVLTTTMIEQTPCRAVVAGLNGWLEIDRTFYNPASMRVVLNDGSVTEYPNTYSGHGLREQAESFKQLVQSGKLQSDILSWKDTVDIMKSMDTVREQIGLKYPFEN